MISSRQFGAARMRWIVLLVAVSAAAAAENDDPPYATCGDCYCIPPNDGLDPCPTGTPGVDIPQGPPWDNATILQYEALTLNNPMTLNCDPYNATACPVPTDPTQDADQVALGDEAACAIKYDTSSYDDVGDTAGCPTAYDLVTYDSKDLAEADGAYLTHHGACGVCSTTQDLAVYMKYTDLTSVGKECVVKGLGDAERGIACFMDIGYTRPCAEIWMYNGFNTQRECLKVCTSFTLKGDPNNGPPPTCDLADCLECDETNSGPIFSSVGGRTRRNSGMLSTIVRPCEDILVVDHVAPCDAKTNGTDMTSAPTGSPSAGERITLKLGVLGLFSAIFFSLML